MEEKTNIHYRSYRILPKYLSNCFPRLFKGLKTLCEKDEYCWVMFDEKNPIACIYGGIEDTLIDSKGSLRAHLSIFRFEVRKSMRKSGYGRMLFNWIVENYNAYKVGLNFLDDDALRFWHKLGFRRQRGTDWLVKKTQIEAWQSMQKIENFGVVY